VQCCPCAYEDKKTQTVRKIADLAMFGKSVEKVLYPNPEADYFQNLTTSSPD